MRSRSDGSPSSRTQSTKPWSPSTRSHVSTTAPVPRFVGDGVAGRAAEHDVGAGAGRDRVVAADRRVDGDDEADEAVDRVGVSPGPPWPETATAAACSAASSAAVERGAAEAGDRHRAGHEPHDEAAVAEDDVAAGAAVEAVVALAAEDHERQRRGLRVDGVVVGLASAYCVVLAIGSARRRVTSTTTCGARAVALVRRATKLAVAPTTVTSTSTPLTQTRTPSPRAERRPEVVRRRGRRRPSARRPSRGRRRR